jgi:predicted peptidase
VSKLFDSQEFHFSGGQFQDKPFQYRLYVPKSMDPKEKCPLLVWLHGKDEGGSDNEQSLRYLNLVLQDRSRIEKLHMFILVPQCPTRSLAWNGTMAVSNSNGSKEVDMVDVTYEMVQEILKQHPIDPDRVYMLGICSGANGCWEMASRHPEMVAAMVPTASVYNDVEQAANFQKIPIWVFHNSYDHPESMEAVVDAVRKAGGDIHLTILMSTEHGGWQAAIQRYEVVDWLSAQSRGVKNGWLPPGQRPWRWWHVLTVPIAFVVLASWSVRSERKRRQRKRLAAENPPISKPSEPPVSNAT